MTKYLPICLLTSKTLLFLFLMVSFLGNAQHMKVNILGGAVVTSGGTLTINSGNSLTFQITNVETGNCSSVRVQSITSNNPNFSVLPTNANENIKPANCNGTNFLNFTVTRGDAACTTENAVITIFSNEGYFTFTLTVNRAPIISVLGGTPPADIINGATTTTANNGTYFGIVEEGTTETRNFIITNTGSCPLAISSITSSLPSNFIISANILLPNYTYSTYPTSIAPGSYIVFFVTFMAGDPIANEAIITINQTSPAGTFTFRVNAEVFDFDIPGPGGITADFRLWLKATRGVTSASSKVSYWKDLGSNGKSATQTTAALQPTYLDNVASNINFNPVIKFENNGTSLNQYLENLDNGFYSQDIFIVMESDVDVTSSSGMTIFSGTVAGNITPANYVDDLNDVTGIGFGNFTSRITGELLWFNQGSSESNPHYSLTASSSRSYSKAGIINARNKTATPSDGMSILYNTVDDTIAASNSSEFTFANLGFIDTVPEPDKVYGTPYKIGKNAHSTYGNLNGRVAEIFTFAERVPDDGRQKIETYLAIKYGITLGATSAEKDYVNSAGIKIWDVVANSGYNYNIAGIGKDQSSDLNQKQSKSINEANEVTIGLGLIDITNNANTNEFANDKDFLVWGCDNGTFTGTSTNTVTIAPGITTSLTRINRKWKIVETGGDVENVFVGIPSTAFSGFTKTADEEYVLIVSDNGNFTDNDIIDVVPLKIASTIYGITLDKDGSSSYQTWYDFEDTKYFTIGKSPKLSGKRAVNIGAGDYMVGEYALNLNINAFTISAWVKSTPSVSTRTIMAKGTKLQLRLNSTNNIEVMVDNEATPRFTSDMALNDGKWHNVSFVYASGTVFLYIDGILDKSVQGVNPPTPNYNRFSIGAVYVSKGDIRNPFLGEIDEVYVWDQGLSHDQVRYLMNQEIEKFAVGGVNKVNGKAIPQAITNNEVASISWSTLRAYYDFNSFYGTTVEGLTDARNFLRIKYLNKIRTIVDIQTAPLPYVSDADGVWGVAGTWANSSVQNLPNSIGLDGQTTIDWNIVETSHDITSGDRNIEVLSLKNNSGKITLADPNGALDETNSGQALRVSHYLELDGSIDLVGESQLVQDDGSTLDQDSGGFIERDQQGTANSYNYNYWSSSVGPITAGGISTRGTGIPSTNANYAISGILNDGTTSSAPSSISFNASYTYADKAYTGLKRISSYWLYTFNGTDNDYNSWRSINQNTSILAGEGYTMKGTSGAVAITTNQNYVFKGKPYNGDFTLPIALGNDRLIGNPYPSALNADEFILDNLSVANGGNNTNGNIFNGALYFWDHFGQENSHYLAAYVGGYATYTLMGGVEAISNDIRINNNNAHGVKKPEQYIPVGQGFFVIAANTMADTLTGTVVGGNIVFKNSQRVFVPEGATTTNVGSLFFKGNKKIKDIEPGDKRTKIRLKFDSPKGYHRQLLAGIDEKTSNHFDLGYDAAIVDINAEDMFWTFDGAKFVIQAVNNFNTDQELPLGVKIAKAGLATIKIDELENLDKNISLHIKDKLTGETHNISKKAFEINLEAGQYLDRFVLIFKMQKIVAEDIFTEILLAAELQPVIEGIHVFMDNTIGELQIKNNSVEEILSVTLYNYLGQRVNNWNTNLNRRTISLPINSATGIYIVQITTKTGKTVKKISVE